MDTTDKKILAILQKNAAAPIGEISTAVGLSQTPCWRRIKKLEDDGIITRRVALIDPIWAQLNLTAFVAVKTAQHTDTWLAKFASEVAKIPEIMEIHRMTGDIDYLLKIVARDMAHYDEVYKRLITSVEFSDVSSNFSMERIKETTELPLDYI